MKALDLKTIFHNELDLDYGKDEVDSFFFMCTEYYLSAPRFQFTLQPDFTLTHAETDNFFRILEDLKQHRPIQYIIGETEFYGLPFKVNENVLIPRPETEELVDWVIKSQSQSREKPIKILDIGTGSGCIAVSLAKNLPNAKVYALDVSKEAIEVAKQNAMRNKVEITFIEADILNVSDLFLEFDIIISNPPYVRELEKEEIKPNVLDNEPHLALFVKDKNPLVFYNAIIKCTVNNLKENGQLYFEINQYLGRETERLLVDAHFKEIELKKDLKGNDRMIKSTKK